MTNDRNTNAPPAEPFWPVTWDEVKEAELDDALRATPAQRLAWLEEALEFARLAEAARAQAANKTR